MHHKQLHVLAIGSFAVHGTASLKTFITILGEKVLPVPSLLLNGLTNMSLVRKFEPPFRELLKGTLELAESRGLRLILYVGYLGYGDQAGIILEMTDHYKHLIDNIIIDPVCGDHGRTYVPQDVIDQWPLLIHRADIVFPNVTELKLFTSGGAGTDDELQIYAAQFRRIYPLANLVVTSVKHENQTGITWFTDDPESYLHEALPLNYGGSGDALVALFISNHFYKQPSKESFLSLFAIYDTT